MDEIVARIVTNLESQLPISQSFLKDLEALLDYTINSEDPIDLENLYSELSSRNLSLTSLTNAVSSAMDSGFGPITSILASKVYLLLLLSPDSPVFTIFSPIAFLSLLRAIRLAVKNPSLGSKEGNASQQISGKKKGVRNQKKSRVENMDTEENEGEKSENGALDVKDMFSVLEKLEKALNLVHLDRFPDCLKALVQTVCDIPITFEVQGNSNNLERLCTLCSRILGESLKLEHGNQEDTAAEVLKAITPLILLSKSPARRFGLDFVVNRMVRIGECSNDVKKAVANLPKYLVHKAPERAEARALAVESIIDIVGSLDSEDQVGFADYVVKMSQGKGQFRLLSIDLIYALMMSLRGLLEFEMVDNIDKPWGLRLLEALIQRCSDSTAGIRARALTNLAQLVVSLSGNDKYRLALKESMGYGNEGSNWMNDILKSRCVDEKAAVRKAALSLLSKLTLLLGEEVDEELIKTVGMTCSDPLVSIRKVAISALSEVFRTYSNCLVIKEWLHSIPRLINDNETSIQEECENLFSELVLGRVSRAGSTSSVNFDSVPYSSNNKKDSNTGVLGLLKEMCDGEVSPWVKKICSSLGRKKKLKPKVAIALQNIIRSSESRWLNHCASMEKWTAPPGAWFLLSEVSPFLSKAIDWEFLLHHWQLLDKNQSVDELQSPIEPMTDLNESNSVSWAGDRVFLLQTISSVSVELPPEPAADLAHDFFKRLEGFNMHSTEVNAHVKALRNLCKRKTLHTEEADSLVTRWVNQLHSKASQVLDTYMSKISGATSSKETAFLTPLAGTSRNVTRASGSASKLLAQAIIGVYTIGSLVIVCPSADFKSIVPLIHTIITSGTSDPKSRKLPGPTSPIKKCAPSLYIQAWITMGKICLADGKLAKRYIPLFVQELEKSDCAALRNNIVVMMADFCVRYTALVDCYMSKITNCLRDPCELVRRQTFVLLARLLQRDYVKWRGVLFLRFLLCLVDESEKIRQLSDFLFGNILKAKAPLLAYNSFVEAIFVLNDCNAHTGRSNPNSPRNENRIFSIRGNDEKSRSQRMHTYTTLLKQMAPEHLLATFAKVCAEILAAASDGMLSLDDITGQSVLRDAFLILSSKEIRIQANRGASSDTGDIEEEVGENPAAASKGKVITQAVRKGLIQNTIPIFIELKRLLESKNSPLMGSLMDCLRILLKDYKNEIEDILVADQQLRKELLYDMEKHESIKATTKAVEAMQRSETPCRSPKDLPENVCEDSNVANAVADAVAAATVRSVLRDANHGILSPLSAMGVPKVKSSTCGTREGATPGNRPNAVIESLRRRQAFDSDEEN